MIKKNNIIKKINLFIYLILILICIKSIQVYAINIGLFNDYDILISGNEYIDKTLIEETIYPYLTSSLLAINLIEIQKIIESIDFIETIQISKILPHTLLIHVIERSPIVLLHGLEHNIFIDKNGTLLAANKESIATFPVPVISILDTNKSIYDIKDVTSLFQFLLIEYPTFYDRLSEIKIKSDFWEFYSDPNTKIYADIKYLKNQLIVLKNFETTIYPMKNLQDYSYIDLRIKNQVIVKEKYRKG